MLKHAFRYVLNFSKKEKEFCKEKFRTTKKIKSVKNVTIKKASYIRNIFKYV